MAETVIGVNDDLAVQVWGKRLYVEALKKTLIMKFCGEGPDNVVQVRDELSSGAGAKVTYGLRMQLKGQGVSGEPCRARKRSWFATATRSSSTSSATR